MDIVAHTLWAAAGVAVLQRGRALTRRSVIATLGLAATPWFMALNDAALLAAGLWLLHGRRVRANR